MKPMEAISFSWLVSWLGNVIPVAKVEQIIADAWKNAFATLNFQQLITLVFTDMSAAKALLLSKATEVEAEIVRNISALGSIPAAAANAIKGIVDGIISKLLAPKAEDDNHPVVMLQGMHRSPEAQAWLDAFRKMSREEREAEVNKAVTEVSGAHGVIITIIMTMLIDWACLWGLDALKKLIPAFFPPANKAAWPCE